MISQAFAQQSAQLTEHQVYDIALRVLSVVGGVLAALGATAAFLITRYWNNKDREYAERSKLRDILYESLKWFEGGTQKRSIGIAVVNTSWASFEDFQPLWLEVFANQAIYLLAGSNQGTDAHEHDNLRRIMEVLVRERQRIGPETASLLLNTLADKDSGGISSGLAPTPELKARLKGWRDGLK